MNARSEFRYRPSHVARNGESESISLIAGRLLSVSRVQAVRVRNGGITAYWILPHKRYLGHRGPERH